MWQDILVGLIVAAAALALLWRWLPARWRTRVAQTHPLLARLAPASGGGCAGCADSGHCPSARKP